MAEGAWSVGGLKGGKQKDVEGQFFSKDRLEGESK